MTPAPRRPIVMLVTNRFRLAERVGARPDDLADVTPHLLSQIASAASVGVPLVQLREPDLDGRALTELARTAMKLVQGSPTRLLVNGRPDVALAAGTDGVHLPEQGLPARRVRALLPPPAIVGVSIHGAPAESDPAAVDYAVFGTVYQTSSKAEGHRPAGADELRRVVAAASVPVLAIGGVTVERLAEIAATGAAGIAAIELFLPRSDSSTVTEFRTILESVQEAFDTVKGVS